MSSRPEISKTDLPRDFRSNLRGILCMVILFAVFTHIGAPMILALNCLNSDMSRCKIPVLTNPISANDVASLTALLCASYYFIISASTNFNVSPSFKYRWDKLIIPVGIFFILTAFTSNGAQVSTEFLEALDRKTNSNHSPSLTTTDICNELMHFYWSPLSLEHIYFLVVTAFTAVVSTTLLFIVRNSDKYNQVTIRSKIEGLRNANKKYVRLSSDKGVQALSSQNLTQSIREIYRADYRLKLLSIIFVGVSVHLMTSNSYVMLFNLLAGFLVLSTSYFIISILLRSGEWIVVTGSFTVWLFILLFVGVLESPDAQPQAIWGTFSSTIIGSLLCNLIVYWLVFYGQYKKNGTGHLDNHCWIVRNSCFALGLLPITPQRVRSLKEITEKREALMASLQTDAADKLVDWKEIEDVLGTHSHSKKPGKNTEVNEKMSMFNTKIFKTLRKFALIDSGSLMEVSDTKVQELEQKISELESLLIETEHRLLRMSQKLDAFEGSLRSVGKTLCSDDE